MCTLFQWSYCVNGIELLTFFTFFILATPLCSWTMCHKLPQESSKYIIFWVMFFQFSNVFHWLEVSIEIQMILVCGLRQPLLNSCCNLSVLLSQFLNGKFSINVVNLLYIYINYFFTEDLIYKRGKCNE